MPEALALYDVGLVATDAVLAKALGLPETTQIARRESRLRVFMLRAWDKRAGQAATRGASVAARGGTAEAVEAAVDKAMQPWVKDVNPRMASAVEDIYRLARTAGWRKGTGQTTVALTYDTPNLTEVLKAAPRTGFSVLPAFDLVDEEAVQALQGHQVFWIGDHYDENISKAVANSAREAIVEAGQDRAKAGLLVKKALEAELGRVVTPGGFHGSAAQYFEGLAANAATVSRAHGQMSSFMRIGATTFTITNPNDSRTCPICSHMDGKVFTVQQGAEQMSKELAAKSPDDIKKVHPWIGVSKMKALSPTPGAKGSKGQSDKLAKAGFSMPPFHFRCRDTVDITEDETFGEPLIPPTPTKPVAVPGAVPGAKPHPDDKILAGLLNSVPKSTTALGEGVNQAKVLNSVTPDGRKIRSVWKSVDTEKDLLRTGIDAGSYHSRDAAVYQLDRLLGGETVVPPTISRDLGGKFGRGSMQHFKSGAVTNRKVNLQGLKASDPTLRRTTLLDYITANDDRHGNNVMYTFSGSSNKPKALKLVAIDNGLGFPKGPPARYIFPTNNHSLKPDLLTLNAGQRRWIKEMSLDRVAEILNESGNIPKPAIRSTLVRIRSLQKDPKAIKKILDAKIIDLDNADLDNPVLDWMTRSSEAPGSLLDSAELSKIDKIIDKL